MPHHPLTNFKVQIYYQNEPRSISSPLSIKTNIFRIQAYRSIMCGYFCIGFIDFMFARETLIQFTNLFLPNNFNKTMI